MNEKEEEFIHFVSCIESLNSAWRLLNTIKEQSGNVLLAPAFRFALIEYSKPYRESRGSKKRRLDTSCIPKDMLDLHERITDSRDQIHSHSDLTIMDPKVYVHEIIGQRFSGIVKNKINGIEELPNIEAIVNLIEGTLDKMYEREKILEAALPL